MEMGTEVQSKMYLQGYYSLRGLNNNAGKGAWLLHQEQKTMRSGRYQDIFLTRPDMDGYEEYEKELLRQTILKHETIFRNQLHELHRLYKLQRDLMKNIRGIEPHKHLISAWKSQSSNVFPSEDDKKRWQMPTLSLMDSSYGIPSSDLDNIQTHCNSVKGTTMQSNCGHTQSAARWKDCESVEPKSSQLQRRFFDLEIPADEFINKDVEQQGFSEVSGMHGYPPCRTNEIAFKRDEKLSICLGNNADALGSTMHLRKTSPMDPNETIQVEEPSASVIIGNNYRPKDKMQRQNLSASAYSSFKLLGKEFSQNMHNERDGAVSNLRFENETQQQDWLSYPFEAGKTRRNRSSFCGVFQPEDFPKVCESSQVEGLKAHDPAPCFLSDQHKMQQHIKRTIFGVEIADINNDTSVVASHPLGLGTPLVPKSDVANSESFPISAGTKPPGSLRQFLTSTHGNTSLQSSPNVTGEFLKDNYSRSIPDSRAEVSHQNDVHLGSQSESKESQGRLPSVHLGFLNDISDRHFSFEQFQQHEPQEYHRGSGCIVDVNSAKEIKMDAVSLNNPFNCQKSHVSVDWPRNRENSQGDCSWLRPMPNSNAKYSREGGGSDQMNLSSWQNHSLQVVDITEMREGLSQSFVQDSLPATRADDGEHGKIEIGDYSSNTRILGFPIMDKPHVPKDLPYHNTSSQHGSVASGIDNGNPVKAGLVTTDLAHDPMSPRSGVLCKVEDQIVPEGWVNQNATLRHKIDLNICVTDEDVPSTPSSPIATKIDLEARVGIETEKGAASVEGSAESITRESFDSLHDESRVPRELVVAADTLVSISSSHMCNLPGHAAENLQEHATHPQSDASLPDSLYWLADIISSYKGDVENEVVEVSMLKDRSFQEELIPDGMDYFELMTLNLTESKVENHCYKPQILENPKDENKLPRRPRRSQTRRGRQRKDFQRDILPSLTSLSRNEMTEDLQTIEGLIKATGGTWQSCLGHRNPSKSSGSGRRRSGVPHPSPTETSVCLPQVQQPSCTELGFEERSLAGWGKRTRRPPRQRCLVNSPPLPPK
ncbi:uncharacterized protein LOC122307098 isoform X2 [Carya illinoinensis]|uniref:Uncharacterized protein n=1 Tax=Carya illinoinensis TaxID=32201 RepID=A0A8T1QPZ3_CARIL|nr:uncharacterized protein LOC122307098 isoform X2 [Carya illinoinensis]KAG6656980.1 hypothetical protein CIPAW_04G059000 [Carya illinoinensis]